MTQENSSSFLMPDESKLKQMIADVLQQAKKKGATQAEAGLSISQGLSVSARMREVETIEMQQDNGLGITVYFGQHKGTASTSNLDPAALQATIDAACNIAKYTSEDSYSGLADADLMATEFPDLDLFHPWQVDSEQAMKIALECESAALDFDGKIVNSEGASVDTGQSLSVYGNSHGFLAAQARTRHSISCSVVAEHNGSMQRDYWYDVSRLAGQLDSAKDIGIKTAERTLRRLDAQKLKTQTAPILFSAEMARGLIGHVLSAIKGSAQYRKSSFLLGKANELILPEWLSIHENPYLMQGLSSAAYDSEGVATTEKDIVTNGRLNTYLLSSYSARKLNLNTTGHAGGVKNISVTHGDKNLKQMLSTLDKGLYVTELMGQGVNLTTGDYSRGATGFWVENGEIQYPVEEVTIAGNLNELLMRIVEIGADIDTRSSTRLGSLLISEMMIAGGK